MLQVIPVQGFEASGLRLLYDFTFYVIWVLIGLGIFLGLINDNFSATRKIRVSAQYIYPIMQNNVIKT